MQPLKLNVHASPFEPPTFSNTPSDPPSDPPDLRTSVLDGSHTTLRT